MAAPGQQMLQVDDLTFGYGADRLFEGVAFSLAAGDRLALVAPNGAGKSTLLRLIAGELPPDRGRAVRRKDATVGYYRQSHELDAALMGQAADVMDAFLAGFEEVVRLRHALHEARETLGDAADGDAAMAKLARLEDAYHLAHGDDLERKIEILAVKLGFSEKDLARKVTSLSGGERGRLQLGTVLAREPDLLLLDEPTNHLDIETISWLEDHLRAYRGALLVVSHDRRFLDRVTNQTCELGSRSFRLYPVSYGMYVVQREEELARERALVERQQAFVDKTQDFIRRNIAGQKTKQAQSRRKMLDKLEKLDRPEDIWAEAQKLRVRFAPAARSGDIVLDAKGLAAQRGGRTLFSGLDLLVRRGERIGIVGPNGAGKTTLLRILAGTPDLAHGDRGDVRRGTNLQEGYFDQHLGALDPKKTAVQEVRSIRGDMNDDAARQYLARFRITGDDALRVVSGFSGGERSRLALAKLLLEPRNLLFLDEPTNHLDIPACEILEGALVDGFEGTLILVSHDRQFLENVTTRLVVVKDGVAEVLPGGFREYAHRREQAEAAARPPTPAPRDNRKSARPPARLDEQGEDESLGISWTVSRDAATARGAAAGKTAAQKTPDPADDRRREHEQRRQASRDLEKKRKRVAELEASIAQLETELASLRAALLEDPKGDWAALADKAERERAASRTLDGMVEEWTRLSEQVAAAGAEGDKARA
jgi:ATP-binding cassette subfamily F protein 3